MPDAHQVVRIFLVGNKVLLGSPSASFFLFFIATMSPYLVYFSLTVFVC